MKKWLIWYVGKTERVICVSLLLALSYSVSVSPLQLEINGYDVAGWAQDKPEESTTHTNKQRQMALILCGTLLVVMFVKIVVPRMVEAKGMVVEL